MLFDLHLAYLETVKGWSSEVEVREAREQNTKSRRV